MTFRTLTALTATLLATPRPSSAQSLPAKAAVEHAADSIANAMIAAGRFPGASVAVVRGNDTLVMKGYGTADIANKRAATAETIWRVGSVTKQFTSSIVMRLVEQKKVRLDDSIGTYLPTLPMAWQKASVRQLLNHTSGVPSYTDVGPRWVARWAEDMTPETLVSITAQDTMWFAPGARWAYDNTGYVVLGMLIEKIAGRSWAAEVAALLKPLGLTNTRVCDSRPSDARAAVGYSRDGSQWSPAPYLSMTQPYAAGSICSTVHELPEWNRALGTGKVVSGESYVAMTTPTGAAQSQGYGFGLMRQSIGTHTVITHGGAIHGFIAANLWVPDAALSVSVLTNAAGAPADQFAQALARIALGAVVPLSDAERKMYVGVYSLMLATGARDFTFTDRDGTLYGQLAGQSANPLIPMGNRTFGADFDPTLRILFTVEGDRATKLLLQQRGAELIGLRKQ